MTSFIGKVNIGLDELQIKLIRLRGATKLLKIT